MKTCTKCGETKAFSDFYDQKGNKDGKRSDCKSCHRKQDKDAARFRKYGINEEQFAALKTKQNFKCAICYCELLPGNATHVDHNHKTGTVRGLLCNSCNRGLGYFKDSSKNLKEAINYLEKQP